MNIFEHIDKETHRVLLQDKYKNEKIVAILKTEFRWRWGWPFPYLIIMDNSLDIIAVKQGQLKIYITVSYEKLTYAKVVGSAIEIKVDENEYILPIVEIFPKHETLSVLVDLIERKTTG